MPYEITFWSKPYLSATGKNTIHKDTAAEAWTLVRQLEASDETVEIRRVPGGEISRAHLRMLAEQEAASKP
jgi:hypothetical protein